MARLDSTALLQNTNKLLLHITESHHQKYT